MKTDNPNSPAKKKLISYLLKRNPNLSEKDISTILTGIKRFVDLTRKIYTEPQAHVSYKDRKVGKKIKKIRVLDTKMEELAKIIDKPMPIREAMDKFSQSIKSTKHER